MRFDRLSATFLLLTILFTAMPAHAMPDEGDGRRWDPRPPTHILRLLVVDALSGQPIAGARVTSGERTAYTDGKGRARLRAPTYPAVVHTSSDGYLPARHVFVGESSATVSLAPLSLSGVVRDEADGRPIIGAFVYDDAGHYVRTDKHGYFRLPNILPDDSFTVKVAGYRRRTFQRGSTVIARVSLRRFVARGVYIPFGLLSNAVRIRQILDMVQNTELNTVVVDVKGDRGRLAYPSTIPLAREISAPQGGLVDLSALVGDAHRRGIYIVARIVVFKDDPLATAHPEWATRRADGTVWRDRENLGWGNPFRKEVQDYNIAIAKEIARLGFDEIQLDYVRFPSDGDIHNIVYEEENTAATRRAAIESFMSRLSAALRTFPVFTSADVFGLVPWVNGEMGIGQQIENIAPFVDYLCPMVYPSTFAPGSMGFEDPALHPYEVVFRSVRQARKRTTTIIRPWLQHYSLYGITYGPTEYLSQRRAAEEGGGVGWTYWNAGGKYDPSIFAPAK